MNKSDIHIGDLIREVLDKNGVKAVELARRINKSRQHVNSILNKEDIDVKLLFTISEALDYDFMKHFLLEKPDEEEKESEENVTIQVTAKARNLEPLLKWITENSKINLTEKPENE